MARIAAAGHLGGDHGRVAACRTHFAVAMSAAPSSRPRSDGLIGVASTGPGPGRGRLGNWHLCQRQFESPLLLIRERSCSPEILVASLMLSLQRIGWPACGRSRIDAPTYRPEPGRRHRSRLFEVQCETAGIAPMSGCGATRRSQADSHRLAR